MKHALFAFGMLLACLLALSSCGDDNGTDPQNPPSISSLSADPDTLNRGESSTITCVAQDSDNDVLNYDWSASGGTINGTGDIVTWVSPDTAGTYSVECKVSDDDGIDSATVDVVVQVGPMPTEGLVVYYPFNGNAHDESGGGHHGTVHGAILTDDRLGVPERAYSFDGSDDYISAVVTLPYGSEPRSISLWFNTTSMSGSNGWYTNTAASWGSPSDNKLCAVAVYYGYLMFGAFGNPYDVHTNIIVADGLWHHTVVTYDGSTLRIYLDNTEVVSASRSLNTTNNGTFLIGDRVGQSTHNLDGLIDDVRVYDRALRIEEVETLYHEGDWDM
jgi:hypothetical protein